MKTRVFKAGPDFYALYWDISKREDERESQDQTQAETQENFTDNSNES